MRQTPLPASGGEAAEIEFIVIAEEKAPLCSCWQFARVAQSLNQRAAIGSRQCVEEVLIDVKIEHHV